MRLLALIALILTSAIVPVRATPPDLVCSGGDILSRVRFVFPLMTTYANWYDSGVMPMSTYHTEFEYGDPDNRKSIEFYSEHMIAQWLDDGRADLRFYLEEELEGTGEITSYDLIIRTKNTGQRSEESGQFVHQGSFVFRIYDGSLSEGVPETLFEEKGKAVCD